MSMLNKKDVIQLASHGLDIRKAEEQLARFREGFPYLKIKAPASVGKGVVCLSDDDIAMFEENYDGACAVKKVVKFVPASGAATRMFKDLYSFLSDGASNQTTEKVLANIDNFAFGEELKGVLPENASDEQIIKYIVDVEGLGYGAKPKALILFHRYGQEVRTALEEHLVEGAAYASCAGRVNIHFTVSPEHRQGFIDLLNEVVPAYEKRFGVKYDISLSAQKPSTDTVAVNPDNTPFRNADGSLLLRPAGHGALLANLADIDADVIFVKNIDNITTDGRRSDTIKYKKALAGQLLDIQGKIFGHLEALGRTSVTERDIEEAAAFVMGTLNVKLPEANIDHEEKRELLIKILDRPLRVCGMVRNEGEPGGGPFFAVNADGTESLQIVESSQIAPEQKELMKEATHFNPVDLVCAVKDHKGDRFDLERFVDHATGFISEKSKDGKPLKAQELPGLWNGSMSYWNTVFTEVPIATFTPVKVVADLLRPEHQGDN